MLPWLRYITWSSITGSALASVLLMNRRIPVLPSSETMQRIIQGVIDRAIEAHPVGPKGTKAKPRGWSDFRAYLVDELAKRLVPIFEDIEQRAAERAREEGIRDGLRSAALYARFQGRMQRKLEHAAGSASETHDWDRFASVLDEMADTMAA